MPPRRRGRRPRGSSPASPDETPPPPSKRQRSKAAKQRFKELRQQVSAWVNTEVNPKLQQLALEFDIPIEDVRELAHLVLPAAAKQRRISLWQTVVSVSREEGADLEEASRNASEIYARLQTAIADDDFDNEELVMYELRREELNAERDLPKVPKTAAKADRAVIADVTRGGDEIVNMLHVLRDSAAIEFCIFICPGNDRVAFPPHIYTTPKVTDFFKLKTKLDPTLFGQELAGYTQHGSKVYEMLAVNDPKHRRFVSELLGQQLCEVTGNPKAKLAYVKYDEMCSKYGIKIVGWPASIPFQSMERTTYGNAQKLHMLIRDGTLRIVRTEGANPPTADPTPSTAAPASRPSTNAPAPQPRPLGDRGRGAATTGSPAGGQAGQEHRLSTSANPPPPPPHNNASNATTHASQRGTSSAPSQNVRVPMRTLPASRSGPASGPGYPPSTATAPPPLPHAHPHPDYGAMQGSHQLGSFVPPGTPHPATNHLISSVPSITSYSMPPTFAPHPHATQIFLNSQINRPIPNMTVPMLDPHSDTTSTSFTLPHSNSRF